MFSLAVLGAVFASVARAQVTATGTMGVTNPTAPVMNDKINQTSNARLVSINGINDFCLFAPGEPDSVIGETEDREVAWCVQPRNNARVIPDGTFYGVHFVRTPLYWQVQGWGDFTRLNIKAGDMGGELDPHGATGLGNPVGGNVTTNATGTDVNYEEWMNYISYQQFCIRICIAENETVSAAEQCQHTLDEMGCAWVMPGDYTNGTFTECEADAAYPPGIYVLKNGTTSTFAQRYTGTYTDKDKSTVGTFTVGQTVTPSAPMSIPASSKCTTFSSIGNGIPTALLMQTTKIVDYSLGQTSFSGVPSNTAAAGGAADAGQSGQSSSDKAAPSAGASGTKKSGASPMAAALGLTGVGAFLGALAVFL